MTNNSMIKIMELREQIARLEMLNQQLVDALKFAVQIIGHPDDSVMRHFDELINKAEGR